MYFFFLPKTDTSHPFLSFSPSPSRRFSVLSLHTPPARHKVCVDAAEAPELPATAHLPICRRCCAPICRLRLGGGRCPRRQEEPEIKVRAFPSTEPRRDPGSQVGNFDAAALNRDGCPRRGVRPQIQRSVQSTNPDQHQLGVSLLYLPAMESLNLATATAWRDLQGRLGSCGGGGAAVDSSGKTGSGTPRGDGDGGMFAGTSTAPGLPRGDGDGKAFPDGN